VADLYVIQVETSRRDADRETWLDFNKAGSRVVADQLYDDTCNEYPHRKVRIEQELRYLQQVSMLDTTSSASRQAYIDTGRYMQEGERP
jgi:hypothetical protein